jgi:hypothetical protein
MHIIKPNTLPAFWWAFPWATARYLHQAATAVKEYADRLDACIDLQDQIIRDQSAEITRLKLRNVELFDDIVAGKAIQPDASIYE